MSTLYELTEQFKSLQSLADAEDIPAEVIRDTVEGLEGEWDEKAINVAKFILNAEALADSIKAKAAEMAARHKRIAARAESLRQYMLFNFQATGRTKLTSELFELAVKNNPPSVAIDDINKVPYEFLKKPNGLPETSDDETLCVSSEVLDGIADGIDCPVTWCVKDAEGNIVRRGTIQYVEAEADKKSLQAAFKSGQTDIPGCHPEQDQRLAITVG